MLRYLVFAGQSFYADGGWLDFIGSQSSLADAEATGERVCDGKPFSPDWWHVVDTETAAIVSGKSGTYTGSIPASLKR